MCEKKEAKNPLLPATHLVIDGARHFTYSAAPDSLESY
jgi:hypothetical protein